MTTESTRVKNTKKTVSAGSGCLVILIGIACILFLIPAGAVFGTVLIILGAIMLVKMFRSKGSDPTVEK